MDEFLIKIAEKFSNAYEIGKDAKNRGLPRECNLFTSDYYSSSGTILKIYQLAWENGYDGKDEDGSL